MGKEVEGKVGRKGRREVGFGREVGNRVKGRKYAGMVGNSSVRKILRWGAL